MLTIEVRLFASLRQYQPSMDSRQGATLQVAEGTTLAELTSLLQVPSAEVKQFFVNGRRQELGYVLQAGDRVALFPPIAGGASEARS